MLRLLLVATFCLGFGSSILFAQESAGLESRLQSIKPNVLVHRMQLRGDAKRGALVYYRSAAACAKCHESRSERSALGPKLASVMTDANQDSLEQYIVESILYPSRAIKTGYETVRILTQDGDVVTGLLVSDRGDKITLRDASDLERELNVAKDDIDAISRSDVSMMPKGLAGSLRTEREFYDLVRYVVEVARGGESVARELKPSDDELIVKDDTQGLDHAGILAGLGDRDLNAGQRIYQNHCVNCHGADGNQANLASARAFGTDKLKYGADPFQMLATLTRGNGLMGPMQHLSPRERYQVIHFIRQRFMKDSNPDFEPITEAYLASLPKGNRSGEVEFAGERDFGPVLGSQLGQSINNSLTFRLPDDLSVNYDLHRFRLGDVWQGGFLDLSQTQHYRQRGERMPGPDGHSIPGLGTYGWQWQDSFDIPKNAKPPRGPVRADWAQYRGYYLHDDHAILSYRILDRNVLEVIAADPESGPPTLLHTLRIAAGSEPLQLCVGKQAPSNASAGAIAGWFDQDGESISGIEKRLQTSGPASGGILVAPAPQPQSRETDSFKNAARTTVIGKQAQSLDLGTAERTIAVRFRTREGGTLVASTPAKGEWKPDGKTLFIRGGRVVFDIGWVGAISGKTPVADGRWHTAVLHVGSVDTRLYVDGKLEAKRNGFRRPAVGDHVLKVGATATDFGGDFKGQFKKIVIYQGQSDHGRLASLSQQDTLPDDSAIWTWNESDALPVAPTDTKRRKSQMRYVMAAAIGDTTGLTWTMTNDGRLVLNIPASKTDRLIQVRRSSRDGDELDSFVATTKSASNQTLVDPADLTKGGPVRWPQQLTASGSLGSPANGYSLDTIPVPFENPWNAWPRTSALDFFADGRCVVTTHGGDVYLVSGIDDTLQNVTWKRFAAGLFEPFGVRVVDEMIYVTCRDGIKRLHDFNGDDEADFVEAFWIDDDVSSMFHAYNFDLQTDSKGNFYFAKAGQYTRHHRPGTIMRVPPSGGRADVVAWGVRTPNGMGKLADDRFTVSDNQGPWMPAGKVSLITPEAFLGNMPINAEQDAWLRAKYDGELPTTFDEPFIWLPQEVDNSCGGQIWASDPRWGPLSNRLIHSSYGKGWLYYLSLQEVNGKMQSSIVSLPHQWDAGVMRLRINPRDGQMYGVGLSGWQGPTGGKDGCLQRLRYTGEPVRMIQKTRVASGVVELTFNFPLSENATQTDRWSATMWDYLWSRRYGSDQFSVLRPGQQGRDKLTIESVRLSNDMRTVSLEIPNLAVCDQLKLTMELDDQNGQVFVEEVFFTIHNLPPR